MYVLKKPLEITFKKAGVKGFVFPTSELINKSEFLIIETQTGHETTIVERESDFVYYVLDGDGYFEIDGRKEKCGRGDLVVIPAGVAFTYTGKLKMLLIVTPPFKPEQEEIVGEVK